MVKHIKSCLKCPQNLKKILNVKDSSVKQLSIEMKTKTKPGPSSACRSPNLCTTSEPVSTHKGIPSFVDHMDTSTNEMLNHSLAKAIFVSGSPLSLVDHPLWVDFFQKIRPSYKLPSRFRLSSTYLDAQYKEMQADINKQIGEARNLHLQCDGWSNLRNEPIINFIISKPEPVFVEFVMTKTNRHNADYLSNLIINVMEKHGPHKFLVVIGDNAANMRAALTIVQEKFPFIVPLGCLAHLLHLLCGDILKCKTIKSFIGSVVDAVKTIKHSHILIGLFNEISKKKGHKETLKLPGNTRWGSHLFCLKSVKTNKQVLQALAIDERAKTCLKPEVKKRLLNDDVFWVRVDTSIELLNPIVHLTTVLESNAPLIQKVVNKFNELESILIQKIPLSPLQGSEEERILQKFQERKSFGLSNIHFAASILDPAELGIHLKPDQLLDGITFICETSKNIGLNSVKVREELADFRDKQGLWSRKYLWESLNDVSPLLWWGGLRGTCELAELAIKVLGAPVTSAATERSFSAMGFIHSKKRNRLTTERAAKLAYLTYNWKLMEAPPSKPNSGGTEESTEPSPTNQKPQNDESELTSEEESNSEEESDEESEDFSLHDTDSETGELTDDEDMTYE